MRSNAASKQDDADMTLIGDEYKAEEADQSLTLVDQSSAAQSAALVDKKEQDSSTAIGTTKGKTAALDAGVTAPTAAAPPSPPLPPPAAAIAPSADPKAKQTFVEDARDETGAFIDAGPGGDDHDDEGEEFNPVVRANPDEDGKAYSQRHCKHIEKMLADGDCAYRAILANLGIRITEANITGLRKQLHAWLSNRANWVYLGGVSPRIWEELLETLLPPKGWKGRVDARRWWFRSTLAAPLAMLTGRPVAIIDVVQGFTALPLDASHPRSGDVIALHYDSSSKGAEHYDAAELFEDQPLPPVQATRPSRSSSRAGTGIGTRS